MTLQKRIASQQPSFDGYVGPMLLDEKAAAECLGVSVSYLRKARCKGVCRQETPGPEFKKRGKRVFYTPKALEDWVNGLPQQRVI